MKTMEEIKQMIAKYEVTLAECNRVWGIEKLSPRQKELGKQVDKEFAEIADAVRDHLASLISELHTAGIDVRSVETHTEYNGMPYHSFHARVGGLGWIGKKFSIDGFMYRLG